MFGKLIGTLDARLTSPVVWPPLEKELDGYAEYLTGNILNAGAGNRDISPFVKGKVFNQDIPSGLHNSNIDISAPLESIPVADGFFDSIICNGVLEHVEDPHMALDELCRVLKSGGHLYLCVPFMQPEHKDPGDYQRYTRDGLQRLVRVHGFDVVKVDGLHSVYHTLGWMVEEWLKAKVSLRNVSLKLVLYPVFRFLMGRSHEYVESVSSGFRVLAVKK